MGRKGENVRENGRTVFKNTEKSKARKMETAKEASSRCPIDVYSRLKFPHVIPSIAKRTEFVEEDSDSEEIEFDIWPRFIFVSNLCIICMEESKVLCEFCEMVSYCSNKHRKQGFMKHRDMCKILADLNNNEAELSLVKDLSAEQYRIYRVQLIQIVQQELNRNLDLWEKEVLLYPRICRGCREFSKSLKTCPVCKIDFYCENHENDHLEWCKEFQVYKKVLQMQHSYGYVEPEIPGAPQKTPLLLPKNFDLLMAEIYGYSSYYCKMDCHTYTTLSHLSTVPLTTLYSMQISLSDWQDRKNLVVHVIGAEFQFECINLHVWETLFLHFLPNLETLALVFIGPELKLPQIPLNLLTKLKLCSSCRSHRIIDISFKPGSCYHEYTDSEEYIKPDLVCLFNDGVYRETAFAGRDTWPDTIREFCRAKVPVIVTSYTKQEIPQDVARIQSICDIEMILEPQRNPFASIKPDRNFVSDDVAPLIYKNYYLTVLRGN